MPTISCAQKLSAILAILIVIFCESGSTFQKDVYFKNGNALFSLHFNQAPGDVFSCRYPTTLKYFKRDEFNEVKETGNSVAEVNCLSPKRFKIQFKTSSNLIEIVVQSSTRERTSLGTLSSYSVDSHSISSLGPDDKSNASCPGSWLCNEPKKIKRYDY